MVWGLGLVRWWLCLLPVEVGVVAAGEGGALAFADVDDALGEGAEEGAIVRDDEDGALKGFECGFKVFTAFDVEVVEWFVEEEEVAAAEDEECELEAAAFAERAGADWTKNVVAAEEEEVQEVACFGFAHGAGLACVVED